MSNADSGRAKMWESLRSDARTINVELDNKITVLESLSMATDDASILRFDQLEVEVQQTLKRFHAVVQSMSDMVGQMGQGGESAAMRKHTQRFEEIIAESQRAVVRLGRESKKRRERAQLLTKVHSEITIYNESNDLRTLASEQDSLRHTLNRTRQLIDDGEAARGRLAAQRAMLLGIGDKVTGLAERVPYVGDILKRIDKKRRRDVVILALVIALCLLLIFVFW
jgi:Golgi SNAP receptor complex protein 1